MHVDRLIEWWDQEASSFGSSRVIELDTAATPEGTMDKAATLAMGIVADRSDDELAIDARSDTTAFGVLYERHRLAVFRYLRTRTRTAEDASELTAVTFERAFAAMPRYRVKGGGVLAWLLRIARNAAIDASRRPSTAGIDEGTADLAAPGLPEDVALANERRQSLSAAVDALPDFQREAVALRYAAGLTAREIGVVLGKSESATQKLLSRALATIRESFDVER